MSNISLNKIWRTVTVMKIKDIAKIAGVSASTVSKIMNNKDHGISAETRAHVLKIVKEYHYTPYSSVITASTKSLILGVIFRNTSDISMTMTGILETAGEFGYTVIVCESKNSPKAELKNISMLISKRADGILWEPVEPITLENKAELDSCGIPYQIINSTISNSINIDFKKLGYFATETLIKYEHTNISCVLKKGSRSNSFLIGYKQCLFDNNIRFHDDLVIEIPDVPPFDFPMGKITNHHTTGLVISHYAAAINLYEELNRLHYGIPYDISMVSLKDDARIKTNYPPISTFTIPHYEFGKRTVRHLIEKIEESSSETAHIAKSHCEDIDSEIDNLLSVDIPYTARTKKIIVVGSINIDNYLNFDTLPHSGKTVSTASATIYAGGKCLNEALGVAKLGHHAALIANVGNDSDADIIYDLVKKYPIDTIGLKRCQGCQTGQAYIFVQKDGNSMISILLGANNTLDENCVAENERLFSNASFCLLQTEVPMCSIIQACKTAKKYGLKTVMKPSTCPQLPDTLLKMIDIMVPNLNEINDLYPSGTMEDKASYLISKGVGTVIITLGANGCYIKSRDFHCECRIPAKDFVSVDNSCAGDAFISALVSYLLYGYDLVSAAKIATYAAGFSITRQGASASLIDKNTLEVYIKQKEPELLTH